MDISLRLKLANMYVVNFERSITYIIIAILYGFLVHGLRIQHRGRTDHRGHNYNVVLTSQTKYVAFGNNLSLTCKAEHACTVNSWMVKEQNGTYETVVRESTPFNRSKYGAHLYKMEQITIYELIIYRLNKNDVHNEYRCDCDTLSGYMTDMYDKVTFKKDANETKDPSRIDVVRILLVIGGIVMLSIITFLLYTLLKIRDKHFKRSDEVTYRNGR